MSSLLLDGAPLFADRREAGTELARALAAERGPDLVVVGLARGGVEVAAAVARALEAPLDVVAVRKVKHRWQPEYGIGAVTPGDGVYVRSRDGLTDEQVAAAVDEARTAAAALDRVLHGEHPALDLEEKTAIVVDDGLATGATMIASIRWAKAAGAARVVAAVPVAAAESLELVGGEADELVCPHVLSPFVAVGVWYASFKQVGDEDVVRLLEASRTRPAHPLPARKA